MVEKREVHVAADWIGTFLDASAYDKTFLWKPRFKHQAGDQQGVLVQRKTIRHYSNDGRSCRKSRKLHYIHYFSRLYRVRLKFSKLEVVWLIEQKEEFTKTDVRSVKIKH